MSHGPPSTEVRGQVPTSSPLCSHQDHAGRGGRSVARLLGTFPWRPGNPTGLRAVPGCACFLEKTGGLAYAVPSGRRAARGHGRMQLLPAIAGSPGLQPAGRLCRELVPQEQVTAPPPGTGKLATAAEPRPLGSLSVMGAQVTSRTGSTGQRTSAPSAKTWVAGGLIFLLVSPALCC